MGLIVTGTAVIAVGVAARELETLILPVNEEVEVGVEVVGASARFSN